MSSVLRDARIFAALLLATIAVPALAAPTFSLSPVANSMTEGRWAPAYSLLPGGKQALIAGGYDYIIQECVGTVDIYDETTNRFRPSKGRLTYPRDFACAVPLTNGTILIAGGFNDVLGSMRVTEIYDPIKDAFTTAGSMDTPRELFQATRLADGRVLATGGLCLGLHRTVASCEIYIPSTGVWSATPPMATDRFGHAACALADGRVLVVGGTSLALGRKHGHSETLASAEIYDPPTGSWTVTGALNAARDRPTATLLSSGKVLVAGGQGANGASVTFAEIYDPATGMFAKLDAPPLSPRMAHAATALPDGSVFVTGGWDADAKETTATGLVFDALTATFAPLPQLPFTTHDQAQVAFPDGSVLVAGGKSVTKAGASSSVDVGVLYKPAANR